MAKIMKLEAKKKKQIEKVEWKVPEDHVFWCHDGSIFGNMKDLANGLAAMDEEIYAYHVTPEKNDFSKWVNDVIGDEQLSSDLAKATCRVNAAELVKARLNFWQHA
jgi:hypothetical protein